jgi:hypothetical protein
MPVIARPLRLSLLLAAVVGAVRVFAQDPAAPPAVTTAATDTNPAPKASADTPKHAPRVISPELAATLAVGRPKYMPPPPPVEKSPADEELPDLRDVDKPRNGIIRLPKVVVEGSRPPIFTDKQILSQKAFGEKMAKRYYSEGYLAFSRFARYTPLAFFFPSAESSAMAQYYEQERLQNMGDLNEAANNAARAGDKTGSDYIKAQSNDTYMRRMDWGWQGPKK